MKKINIYWGSDIDFETSIESLNSYHLISDLLTHISKTEIAIDGLPHKDDEPMEIENLVIYTDDYGSLKEWALLGFSNNVLEHQKVQIENVWMNNPPIKIFDDIKRKYPDIITENKTTYPSVTIKMMNNIADNYSDVVIGQNNVVAQILSSIYSLKNSSRKRPVTILFLGESGVGKTETAKYISSTIGTEMVRIQFSMQQTNNAYQFIFGAEHGENCLARELIRRKSNIILLDEFDKVHSSFYNAFYQMFDEGVFVDSNYSVDVEKCIIICTTNYANEEEAEKNLGTPIYSRFSKVIKFNPISIEDKIRIAQKDYEYFFANLDEEDQAIISENHILDFYITQIQSGCYRNMRMLKNDIEDAINYEILRARKII
ncbi:MAG: ATP-dependent Clp protease ATP-binding subunit [Lachnospiraceae bacterium]|jgi:ATP-dependent Clp protease ATP-binding subunit ClpA|nr:ATP-dependent Clp protease ATP-binding subunit [Lachnospiraceae bacterium]